MFKEAAGFFGNPCYKGQYEYYDARKKQQLKLALLCALGMALFIGAGFLVYHKKANLLMIPGLLMVLPFSNFFVSWLALLKGSRLGEEKRAVLKPFEDAGMVLYHMMYCDEKGKRMFLDAVVVYQGAIVAYSSSVKADEKVAFESDCITRMKKKAITLRLRVYRDWEEFQARLSEIAPEVPESEVKKVERALDALTNFCL